MVRKTEMHALAENTALPDEKGFNAKRARIKNAVESEADAASELLVVLVSRLRWLPGPVRVDSILEIAKRAQVLRFIGPNIQIPQHHL